MSSHPFDGNGKCAFRKACTFGIWLATNSSENPPAQVFLASVQANWAEPDPEIKMLFFLLFIGSLFSQDTALSRTPVMSAETDGYPSYEPQSHLDRDEGAFVWQTLGSIAGAMGGSGLGGIAGFGIAAATGHVGSFPFPFGDWVVYTATGAFVGMLTGATVGAKTFEPRRRRGPHFPGASRRGNRWNGIGPRRRPRIRAQRSYPRPPPPWKRDGGRERGPDLPVGSGRCDHRGPSGPPGPPGGVGDCWRGSDPRGHQTPKEEGNRIRSRQKHDATWSFTIPVACMCA
jgi:hypothetical protein